MGLRLRGDSPGRDLAKISFRDSSKRFGGACKQGSSQRVCLIFGHPLLPNMGGTMPYTPTDLIPINKAATLGFF